MEELKLLAKCLRRDARDYSERLFAVGTDKTMLKAADAIEALVEAQRWIPVGERLPEKYQSVLAARQGYAPNKQHYACETWRGKGADMTEIDKAIAYWKQFETEIDELYGIATKEQRVILEGQREPVALAIAALREQAERDNPKPLTIEQLRERDGKPVWCKGGAGYSCWCLVDNDVSVAIGSGNPDCIDKDTGRWDGDFYGMTGDGVDGLHVVGWLAYDFEPKEAQHDT